MKRYALVLLSSVLITLSVYPFNLSFLSFIYFVPAFYGVYQSKNLKDRVLLSIFFGITIFVFNFFWAIKTMEFYGKLPPVLSYLLGIPLSIYQTVPFIIFLFTFPYLFKKNLILPALLFPILTNLFPLIFPYSISSTLSSTPYLCRSAEIWGEWGLDFIVILINILVFAILIQKRKKHFVIATVILAMIFVYPVISNTFFNENPFSYIDTIIIQPCIYDGDSIETKKRKFFGILNKVQEFSENKVLIIPESALPDDISSSPFREMIMKEILIRLKLKAVLYNSIIQENGKIYNSNIFLSEKSIDRYNKNHLMLFGEYFPFHSLIQKLPLPIANYENFESGRNTKPLQCCEIKIATPICLESIYHGYTAALSKNSNLIANPTDDEWFLSKKAKMLHFAQVRTKAIENNRYLIAATNNGFTCIVNRKGEIIKKLEIDKPDYLIAKIPLFKRKTIFQYIYPAMPYIFIFAFLILLFAGKDEKSNNS